ncbi:MAG: PaaI family thioesterase [Actinomycetota bacterium]|nr:PaaI family thioesterase [Actinomycetota bacterium]
MSEPDGSVTEREASLLHLGQSMRGLQDVYTATSAPAEVVESTAVALEVLTSALAPYRCNLSGESDYQDFAEFNPAHTLTPEFHIIERGPDFLRGRVRFGLFYRNAFGIANGGAVALLFDTAIANLGSSNGVRAYTANLKLDFRSGTPIDTDLIVQVQRKAADGRKHLLTAQLYDGDQLLAEAESLLVEAKA